VRAPAQTPALNGFKPAADGFMTTGQGFEDRVTR
jgi:hypothetical protein